MLTKITLLLTNYEILITKKISLVINKNLNYLKIFNKNNSTWNINWYNLINYR